MCACEGEVGVSGRKREGLGEGRKRKDEMGGAQRGLPRSLGDGARVGPPLRAFLDGPPPNPAANGASPRSSSWPSITTRIVHWTPLTLAGASLPVSRRFHHLRRAAAQSTHCRGHDIFIGGAYRRRASAPPTFRVAVAVLWVKQRRCEGCGRCRKLLECFCDGREDLRPSTECQEPL